MSGIVKFARSYLAKENPKTPSYLILLVTFRCNASCGFCCFLDELNTPAVKNELTLAEIETIAKQLPGLMFLSIGGGEPFLRKDLVEICQAFYRHSGVDTITIPTNGSRPELTRDSAVKILDACPETRFSIGLSLDAVGERHNVMRKLKNCFEDLVKTAGLLQETRKKYPDRFSMGVLTTVSRENADQVGPVAEFVNNELGADWHTYEIIRDEANSVNSLPFEEYQRIKPIIQAQLDRYSFGTGLKSMVIHAVKRNNPDFIEETWKQKTQIVPCLAGRVNAVIDANGNVFHCELLDKVGNIREAGLNWEKVWFSDAANELREKIKNKFCWCTQCNFQNTAQTYAPSEYWNILKRLVTAPR